MPASYGGSSGSSAAPTTPASALLDAASPNKVVTLNADGEGASTAFEDVATTGIAESLSDADEGDFLVATGAGEVQRASVDPAAVRGVIGAAGATVFHADDGTAAAGSESASVSGTGADSTVTLTASSTARNFGTAGQTAAGWRVDLPAGTKSVEVEVQLTAASGLATGGYRYLGVALSNQTNVTSTLCGVSLADSGNSYSGNMLGGTNAGNGPYTYTPTLTAADRWARMRIDISAGPMIRFATGTGSAGARPGTWSLPASSVPLPTNGNTGTVVDSDSARLWIYLQSFGTGGATSITAKITVRCSL